MTPTIKYPHVRATIERYTFKSILPAQPEEIMSSSFEPTNTKNTDVDNTTPGTGEQSRQPGRWQNFAQKVPAQLLALLAIISVQMGAAVGKGLFSAIGPLGTTFLRLGFAAVLLLILWRPQIRGLTRTQYLNVLLFGIVLAAMNGAFYSAIHYIPLGIAVTLEFVGPLGLALMQSRRVKDICWAGYILCSARIGRSFPGGRGLALAVVVATVAIAPLGIRNGGAALLSPQVLLTGVGIAILSSVIPFSLELEAL